MRIGIGYDIHKFEKGRKLFLGGVEIPFEYGLLGHSDADVLLHAISDAILGAAALGDIGKHFPNTDPRYENISSLILLKEVSEKIKTMNFRIGNIDSTVIAEKPKILKYIPDMIKIISDTLAISTSCVNVKATTAEGLGSIGRCEGISAYAVALLAKKAVNRET